MQNMYCTVFPNSITEMKLFLMSLHLTTLCFNIGISVEAVRHLNEWKGHTDQMSFSYKTYSIIYLTLI